MAGNTAPTQRELADRLNVSQQAVSYALRGLPGVSEVTRQRVLEAATTAGYRPSSAAIAMRDGRTRNVGVVIHSLGIDTGGAHAYDTVSGINSVLEPAGYTTCLVQMIDVEAGHNGMARVFREQALDGMIVHAAIQKRARDRLETLSSRIVWCDAGAEHAAGCLWRDEREAGQLVGRAIVEAGYTGVNWVESATGLELHPYRHRELRRAGLFGVLERAGVPVRVLTVDAEDLAATDAALVDAMRQSTPETAWVACDHTHATHLAHLAAAAGYRIGHDLALACCDDLGVWERHWPNLSRARFDRYAMGQRAARMLLATLDGNSPVPSFVSPPTWTRGNEPDLGPDRGPTLPTAAQRA